MSREPKALSRRQMLYVEELAEHARRDVREHGVALPRARLLHASAVLRLDPIAAAAPSDDAEWRMQCRMLAALSLQDCQGSLVMRSLMVTAARVHFHGVHILVSQVLTRRRLRLVNVFALDILDDGRTLGPLLTWRQAFAAWNAALQSQVHA